MGLSDELKEVIIDKELKLKIYNETRETIIDMYLELRKQVGGADDHDQEQNNIADIDILALLDDDVGKFPMETFIVKESVIQDEWKKRRARLLLKKQDNETRQGSHEKPSMKS